MYNCVELGHRDSINIGTTESLGLHQRSFTIMCWIKLERYNTSPGEQNDNCIIGQDTCTVRNCLHITVRKKILYFGFYGHDTPGRAVLELDTWYHVAFVYDVSDGCQSIYLNGHLDSFSGPHPPLSGARNAVNVSRYANGRGLNGRLSGLRIFTAPLTADMIDAVKMENMEVTASIHRDLTPITIMDTVVEEVPIDISPEAYRCYDTELVELAGSIYQLK